jgi:hypothetical protein
MKHLFFYIGILFVMLSCSNSDLDLYSEIELSENTYYKNENELIQATNEIYRQLGILYQATGLVDIYGELASDNVYIEFSNGSIVAPENINDHRIKTDNSFIETAWKNSYNGIFICNNLLEKLEITTVNFSTPDLKTRLKAEILFIRALIYFNAVRVWGNIPLVLKTITVKESYEFGNDSHDEIYKQIIEDLLYAKSNLPDAYTGNNIGRVTKYGASAVLSKVYLTIGEKQNAEKELKEIIDSNLYSLDSNGDDTIDSDDYLHIFQPDTKNSKESLVEVQYLTGQNNFNANHQTQYTPYHWAFHLPNSTETFRGEGMNTPTQDLIDEFEVNDEVRKEISVFPGYLNLSSGQFINYPFTQKFYDPNWRYPGQNVEVIRYADILLMYSEVTNDPQYLNQVRRRVGLPEYGETGYPSQYNTLAKAIEHERRVELCFEFHRFFDLVRTSRAVEVLSSKGIDITENSLLFPIPQSVIDVNPNIEQNEFYK